MENSIRSPKRSYPTAAKVFSILSLVAYIADIFITVEYSLRYYNYYANAISIGTLIKLIVCALPVAFFFLCPDSVGARVMRALFFSFFVLGKIITVVRFINVINVIGPHYNTFITDIVEVPFNIALSVLAIVLAVKGGKNSPHRGAAKAFAILLIFVTTIDVLGNTVMFGVAGRLREDDLLYLFVLATMEVSEIVYMFIYAASSVKKHPDTAYSVQPQTVYASAQPTYAPAQPVRAYLCVNAANVSSSNNITVFVDGVAVGNIIGGNSCTFSVVPGQHLIKGTVSTDAGESYDLSPIAIIFAAGGTQYLDF